jgi:hypothetical protein
VILGALVGGVVGTLVLTTLLRLGSELRLTRIDLPFMLGAAFTDSRDAAKAIGYAVHVALGLVFSLVYWAIFEVLDTAGWWQGALLGLLHGVVVATFAVNVLLPAVHPRMGTPSTAVGASPLLEPPGLFMRNYGPSTSVLTILAHVVYGAFVGGFMALSA